MILEDLSGPTNQAQPPTKSFAFHVPIVFLAFNVPTQTMMGYIRAGYFIRHED